MSESPDFTTPGMDVRIWKGGTAESHGSGFSDACVDIVAFDGRVVQIVFREDGHIMLRGWCGTYERLSDEREMDLYARGEMGDEVLTYHGELPPVPNPARLARDQRLAALRMDRDAQRAKHDRQRKESEFRKMAEELGLQVSVEARTLDNSVD